MSLTTIFLDGFDHYSTNDELARKYSFRGTGCTISTTFVRTGTQVLRINNSGTNGTLTKTFSGQQYRTFVLGVAVYPTNSSSKELLELAKDGSRQLRLRHLNTGLLELQRGTTTIATGSIVIPLDTWVYLEIEAYIDSTNGWAKVYIDEVLDINFSGNTQQLADNFCNGFNLVGVTSSNATYYDDLYARGAAGNVANGRFGDSKVLTRMPTGPGTHTNLTSSSGNPNWQNVNQNPPDTNTYNFSATPGDKDTYAFAALNDPGAIRAVQLVDYASKTDEGARFIKPYIKSGATEQAETEQLLFTTPQFHTHAWDQDPNTAAAWTTSGVDAVEAGGEVV